MLFFFSGLHSDYHKPSDTWDKINAPDAAKLLDFIDDVALKIDSANERVAFVTVKEEQSGGQAASGGGGGYGPYFGSIPDFGQEEDGVKFSDVRPGSPAAKAGFKAGDILVQFGDKPIHNLYDFTDALAPQQGGRRCGRESAARRQARQRIREAGTTKVRDPRKSCRIRKLPAPRFFF